MVYEVFNVKNETYDLMRNKRIHKKIEPKIDTKTSDEEEETTIDEVIQELRNIVNHAESEQYKESFDDRSSRCNQTSEINVSINALECRKHRDAEKEDSITSTRHSIQIKSTGDYPDDNMEDEEEAEIVPCKILPHPPRKAKSLIHLFVPPDQGLYNKPPDIYDDNFYSSDEGSDSLLSASRCVNPVTKKPSITSFDFNETRAVFNSNEKEERKRSKPKSREESRRSSIKRSESFQTSEKGSRQREYIDSMFYPESQMSSMQRSSSKCSRVDEIVNLIESKKLTKSLDRIDEGLNSMVDIVVLAEPKKPVWPYEKRQRSCSRTSSDGKESPLIPVRAATRPSKPERSTKAESPIKCLSDQPKFFLSNSNASGFNSSTFLVKRGHSNAGFYSGTMLRDAPASMTSLVMTGTHSHGDLKRTMSPMGTSSSYGIHKVTDMPSGLY